MKSFTVSLTCERHSKDTVGGPACTEAFMRCCRKVERRGREKTLQMDRSKRSDYDYFYTEIVLRSNSPDYWLWRDIKLYTCPLQEHDCESTSAVSRIILGGSLTTWQLFGISTSKAKGICVSDTLEIKVRKEFFIDLRLPYSAVQGEQLEIKAIIHNYTPEPITVLVSLMEEKDLCSAAYKSRRYNQKVQVGPEAPRSVPFIIMPMKAGETFVSVKAAVKDSHLSDGVSKKLRVLPQGKFVKSTKIVRINPKYKAGGLQVVTINSEIHPSAIIPNTPVKTVITLTGKELEGPPLNNTIGEKLMVGMFIDPSGSGESTIIMLSLPVIATMYFDNTNHWENVGFENRSKALQKIQNGCKHELKFRKSDGSFARFPDLPSSTRLTAYVAKVFAMAQKLVEMRVSYICDAIRFLILNAQQPNGRFAETRSTIHTEMICADAGTDSDAILTAFCLVAIQESREICLPTVHGIEHSMYQAVTYLETRLPTLTNPYAVAVVSFALATENKLNKDILFKFAAPDRSHWLMHEGNSHTVEATGYALLALVKTKAIEEAHTIVKWLSQQLNLRGSDRITKATIIAYQAVAEYWKNLQDYDYYVNVNVLIPGKSHPHRFSFTRENNYITRILKFDAINKDVNVTATGNGEVILKMLSFYYSVPEKQKSDCKIFNLTLQLLSGNIEGNNRIYNLSAEILYNNRKSNASHLALNIGLPAGYSADRMDLESVFKGNDQIFPFWPEIDPLIIYMKMVSGRQAEKISFKIQQMEVPAQHPATVSVYDFHNKKYCMKFYHPERKNGELYTLSHNNELTCAEESCIKQKKDISIYERNEKGCESTELSKIEYGYNVVIPPGTRHSFISAKHCRSSLGLKTNQTYLIMGTSPDISLDGNSHQFTLSHNTWLEYWPTMEECQTERYRSTCNDMEELIDHLHHFGCLLK
ncbi:complement C3-like isoform 2-T2 [Anableps anableps]